MMSDDDTYEDVAPGYIYCVTQPRMSMVKLGMWRSDLHSLWRRYQTPYGATQTFTIFECRKEDTRNIEADLHRKLHSFSDCNELYIKSDEFEVAWLSEVSQCCSVFVTRPLKAPLRHVKQPKTVHLPKPKRQPNIKAIKTTTVKRLSLLLTECGLDRRNTRRVMHALTQDRLFCRRFFNVFHEVLPEPLPQGDLPASFLEASSLRSVRTQLMQRICSMLGLNNSLDTSPFRHIIFADRSEELSAAIDLLQSNGIQLRAHQNAPDVDKSISPSLLLKGKLSTVFNTSWNGSRVVGHGTRVKVTIDKKRKSQHCDYALSPQAAYKDAFDALLNVAKLSAPVMLTEADIAYTFGPGAV